MNKITCVFMVIVAALFSTAHTQRVDTVPSSATVQQGESVNLLCRGAQSLIYCRIEIPNEEKTLILSPSFDNNPNFKYYGTSLKESQCGVTIQSVSNKHSGMMKCYLGGEDGVEISGEIEILVAQAPIRPELVILSQSAGDGFEMDQEFRAQCISRDGRPAANLTWTLDGETITSDSLNLPEYVSTPDNRNVSLTTVTQVFSRRLRADDDKKILTCSSTHLASPIAVNASTQLNVRFRPVQQTTTNVYGLVLGQTAFINITISSNPRPRTEWIVNGESIPQGNRNGRYEASEPIEMGLSRYNITLTIAELTLEDTTVDYRLKASNALGQTEYMIRVSSSEAAPETGLDIGSIVGIVIGVLCIFIIIILIVVARATGRWCFSGGTLNTDIGVDSEAQVSPHFDDEKAHEEYHPQENGNQNPDLHPDDTKLDLTQQNGSSEVKTNTPV